MKSHSDYDYYGFNRDEITAFLWGHGIDISVDAEKAVRTSAPSERLESWPEWSRTMSHQLELTLGETLDVLVGVDPHSNKRATDEETADTRRWERILLTSLKAGELKFDRHGESSVISSKDLASWCDKRNISRPLPWVFEKATPSTDPELRQALEDARNEVAALKIQAQTLTEQLAETGLGKDYAGILDQNNAFHPPELFVAMNAWRAVVTNGDPRALGKGVTGALTTWLDDNKSKYELSNKAITRLAIVANWNKGGGTPPTPS